jgi:hypothetical protein
MIRAVPLALLFGALGCGLKAPPRPPLQSTAGAPTPAIEAAPKDSEKVSPDAP